MKTETLEETLSPAHAHTGVIDLRSDTVTQPTDAMRAAMANAAVGDDVYGEDPTVNKLEQRAAEIFGREAALFVPTGTMGNQIAIRLHTSHGQEVICEASSHIVDWEMAMVAAFSGCMPRTIQGERGILTWAQIEAAIAPPLYYRAPTGLISLENTHNMAGGSVTPLAVMQEIWAGAKVAKIPLHLDGARVFNAAATLGVGVRELTAGFDTVMFCLSKGLCAPVGSMLVGTRQQMDRARAFRKALGGGMRQAGILAAAGLIALETMTERLVEDHENARFLATQVADVPGIDLDAATVQTNIVIFRLKQRPAAEVVQALKRRGVLCGSVGKQAIRWVTHRDVSRAQCAAAVEQLRAELAH
jgi:threonine aldolase